MSKTIKEQVYSSIFQEIIQGKISPTEVLREKELIEKYKATIDSFK